VHDWEVLNRYAQYHPRWFETPSRHQPADEFHAVVAEFVPDSWDLRREGTWYVASPPGSRLADQGWKLHVSVSTRDGADALRRALPVLLEESVCFKFLLDPQVLAAVNGKLWPRASSGKFITAYPRGDGHFRRLGERLAGVLDGLAGPYILSDRRWPASRCVYYRYGGFRARSVLQVDGTRLFVIESPDGELVPDVRSPYWNPPEWVEDPFVALERADAPDVALADGRFSVTEALRFSNRGGVYKGIDRRSGAEVVIKESRPKVEVGKHRRDSIALLEKEWRLLERLAPTGRYVQPIEFFRQDDHAFLVEQFVPGTHIGRFSIAHNPVYRQVTTPALVEYLGTMRDLWVQLAKAIAAAHERGIVLGDLSFTNVIVSESARVTLIDLESAVQEGLDDHVGLHTPGNAAQHTFDSGVSDRDSDYYALGSIIFGSVVLANGITGFYPPAARRFLETLRVDLGLPGELVALIDDLMGERPSCVGQAAVDALEHLSFGRDRRTGETPRLTLEPRHRLARGQRHDLGTQVAAAVEDVIRYLQGTADVERDDRLFPADLTVFETNPLSVAFGAAGVLYALHRLTGDVPDDLLTWFLERPVASDRYPPGLYLGQAGIAWVLNDLGYPDAAVRTMRSARSHELLWQSPDVLCGAAGYGMACLRLWASGLGEEFLHDAVRVSEHLIGSCARTEQGAHWPDDDGEVPLGYAFGGSGIALFLLYVHLATGRPEPLEVGRRALDFELAHAVWWEGRFAGFPAVVVDDPEDAAIVPRCYWDAGSAGVATTLVRYALVTRDASLDEWLARLATDLSHKYAVMPQLFHGLAGLGNALLDIHRLDGDERYLAEAWQVAEGILLFGIDRPEGLGFPGEQALRESCDFATGAAGVALFLDRLRRSDVGPARNFNFVLDELLPQRGARDGNPGRAAAATRSAT
jgi:tRNA A-37 threonylcarbamoyl transferase component Bud32